MLTVHHLGVSQSDRIVWLCEELGLDYELVRYDRDPVTRLAPAEYQKLTPMGTAPVIVDGDLTLGESGAVMEYILIRYGDGRLAVGPDQANYADYLFWFHFANGSLMPAVITELMGKMAGGAQSAARDRLSSRLDNAYAMIEQRLGNSDYLQRIGERPAFRRAMEKADPGFEPKLT